MHIGAHKTATSHLQNELYQNREMLAEEGIRVFGPGYLRRKGRNLAAMFDLSWSESPSPRRSAPGQLQFLSKDRKRLVFSEENFVGNLMDSKGKMPLPVYPMGPDRVAELVGKFAPVNCQVFLGLRSPASYVASAYSQSLMGGAYVGPRSFRSRNDWRKVDWADYVEKLRTIDGIETVYVWRHEDYARSHRLILRRLLRWKVGPRVETVKERVHPGLSISAVRQTMEWAKEGKDGPLASNARAAFPIGPHHKPFQLYSTNTLEKSDTMYADQMARIESMDGVTVLHPPATTKG